MEILVPIVDGYGHSHWVPRGRGSGPQVCRRNSRAWPFVQQPTFPSNHLDTELMHFGDDDWVLPFDFLDEFWGAPFKKTDAKEKAIIANTNDKFEVKLNVIDYKPSELNVKISNGMVTIEGMHEEKKTKNDEAHHILREQFVSRNFTRTFRLPENVLEDKLECRLASDGQLIVAAPLKAIERPSTPAIRSIPINVLHPQVNAKVC